MSNSLKVNHILLAIAVAWLLIIVTATITALVVRASMKRSESNNAQGDALPAINRNDNVGRGADTYTGVGSVRAVTAPEATDEEDEETGATVIVTAWFSYPKDDKAFFEELATKSTLIRKTIQSYFAAHTKRQLSLAGEEVVKKELRDEINSLLTLGQVGTFYFSEYIFLE